jgi:tRNA threonylcarbamoyladenosine biosynthesis protein TsaE
LHVHSDTSLSRHLPDEAATLALGAQLAAALEPGMNVYLHGDLGAGKTTLVRCVVGALGHAGKVKSPTYTLVEVYEFSRLYLYHFDFYRLEHADDWLLSGFRDYFGGGAVCLVEWPENAGGALPPADLDIHLTAAGDGRDALLRAASTMGRRCLSRLEAPPGMRA